MNFWALTDGLGREFLREIVNEFIQWEKEIPKYAISSGCLKTKILSIFSTRLEKPIFFGWN